MDLKLSVEYIPDKVQYIYITFVMYFLLQWSRRLPLMKDKEHWYIKIEFIE